MEATPSESGKKEPPKRRPTLDELDDFLCGMADEETRDRIGRELLDPDSRLHHFVEGVRRLAEGMTGWSGTDDGARFE